MNESRILRAACDSKWYAHAYSEYLADVAQATSNLMTALQDVIAQDEVTVINATNILLSYGINPDARFILGEHGAVRAIDLAVNSWNELEDPDTSGSLSREYSVEEAFSIVRETWTQCVISSKAFESFSVELGDSTSRVTKFLQDVQASFPIDDSVRNIVGYYQSMINVSPSVDEFVSQFLSASGVSGAELSDDPMAYVNCDIAKYTGCTPGIALDFSTVNKAVRSTVKVAAGVVKGIFGAISAGANWLFNKAKKYVVDTVIDPAVCEYVDNGDQNDGYLDGFAWFGEFIPNVTYSHFATGGAITNLFHGFYDEYAFNWIKIKLKVGEFLFRTTSSSNTWQCYFKPVAIDVSVLANNLTLNDYNIPSYTDSRHAECIEEYLAWLERVMAHVQPVSKDATKEQLYQGFALSTYLVSSIAFYAFVETYTIVNGATPGASNARFTDGIDDYFTFNPILPEHEVTNAQLLIAASGQPQLANNDQNYMHWSPSTGISLFNDIPKFSIRTVMTDIISSWAMCRVERNDYPADYTFVPYSNNHATFSQPSWRLRSDAEIASKRDNFITNAITAVVAVAALAFIGVTATKISKRLFFKRQQALGMLENKMWSGEKLTASERRRYLRYNRKQNASKWLSSGTSDPKASLSNDSQSIIKLIQG